MSKDDQEALDRFATAALQGIIAASGNDAKWGQDNQPLWVAQHAYAIADAMMEERARRRKADAKKGGEKFVAAMKALKE